MILGALLGVSFFLVNTLCVFRVKLSFLNDERLCLMARVILYISNDVYDKVNAIVEQRRQEGARDKDISVSGTASMLLELGLRVYEAQMERKESAFNQTEFNKVILECVVKTQSTVAKILGIESLSPHVSGNPKFEYANMVEDIREKVSIEMERFFPEIDGD